MINIKNNDSNCFLWSHVKHLNPLKTHPERITKADRQMVSGSDFDDIKFPVSKTDYGKIEQKNSIGISVFGYKNGLVFPVYVSDERFEDCMDLWLTTDNNKSHYVYIKDFKRCNCHKTKSKNKKHICRFCLQYFFIERVLMEHKEACLKINGTQSINGSNKFKFFSKQLAVRFEIYTRFESVSKGVQSGDQDSNVSYTKKYQKHIPCSFVYKVVCVRNRFSKAVVFYTG